MFFMKWQILSGIYMMRQKNMFDQKHVRIVLLSVREHMKKYLKFLNGPIRNWYQLFHEAAELVHVVRQSLQNRLLL